MTNWEDIFGPTPASFASRVQTTLAGLEEPKMTAQKHTKRNTIRTIALIAAAAALLMGTALAVTVLHGDFYNSIFGSHDATYAGRDEVITDKDGTVLKTEHYPDMETVAVDKDLADALIGENVVSVGYSATMNGYTFTVADFVVDENGMGALTIDVENPDGLRIKEDGQYYSYEGEFPPFNVSLRGEYASGELALACQDRYDRDVTTDTYTRLAIYFTPFAEELSSVTVDISAWNGRFDEEMTAYLEEAIAAGEVEEHARGQVFPLYDEESFQLPTWDAVAARTAGNGDVQVSVSPIGMKFTRTDDMPGDPDIAIRYADGSEYVLIGDDVYNIRGFNQCCEHPSLYFISFNRLVDVDSIAAVTINDVVITF